MNDKDNLIAIDLGSKRVGVAIASSITKLPSPLITLDNDNQLTTKLSQIIKERRVAKVIVGLPRNLDGNETDQTKEIRQITKKLEEELGLEFIFQDEALSSVRAEEELTAKKGSSFDKGDVDKLAACYILEDYLRILDGKA